MSPLSIVTRVVSHFSVFASAFLKRTASVFNKQTAARVMSVLLITSMLTATTPAAPNVVLASGAQFAQDVRFAYLTSPTLAMAKELAAFAVMENPVVAFFFKGRRAQQAIAKVEVSPNRAVIREGEELPFTAVALDREGRVVQGVQFNWTAMSARKGAAPIKLTNGKFTPQFDGPFEVTAEVRGLTGKAVIQVVRDPYSLALSESKQQTKERAGEKRASNKQRQIRPDVGKVLSEARVFEFQNSTKMSVGAARELNAANENFRKANPNRPVIDPNRKAPQTQRAPKQATVGLTAEAQESTEGGPSAAANEKTKSEEAAFIGVNGYLDSVIGTSVTGCAEEPGVYGTTVQFYIDGDYYSGTYAGSEFTFSGGCNFTFQIPSSFHDGQPHTIAAFVQDSNFNWWELSNSPQSFQIGGGGGGGGGGGTGNNSHWNNTNFPTSDDPGVQPGNPANTGTDGAGSSNFGFSAPVLSLGGRGMAVNLSLNYNSLLWHNDGTNISYDIDKGFPGPGWNIGFGKMMDMGSTGGAMMEDIDGTRHSYEGTTSTWGSYSTYYGRTTDGSFIDYQVQRGPSGLTSGVAYLANGTRITYGAPANGVLYPTYIQDRHGNYMTVAYHNNQGPRITTITDNLGRVVTFNYDGSNRLISVTGPGFNGTTRTYVQLHYTQQTLAHNFTGLTPQVRDASPYQLDAIYYPGTNTGYWFGDANSYSSYGMIAKVSERRNMTCSGCTPTNQGTITAGTMTKEMVYNYPLTAGTALTSAPQYTSMTEDWAGRDVQDPAVTQYSVNNTASPRTTTITLPNGNKIKQSSNNLPNQWNDGLLYQVESLSPSNAVLSKSVTTWEQGDYNSVRVKEIQNTDEKNQTTKQTFTYDTLYNQVATVSEFGYNNVLLRKSVNTYENGAAYRGYYSTIGGQSVWTGGRHIFSLTKTSELLDAANVRLSRTNVDYDQSPLVDTVGVVMYDQTYNPYTTDTIQGPNCVNWDYDPYTYEPFCTEYEQIPNFDAATLNRGNATQTTTFETAANLSNPISYSSTYDITGNLRTATTDCCQQMSFGYTAATQFSQPELQKKGSPTDPNLQVMESAIYDFNTGAVKTATDYNGRTTTVTYDPVMRPVQTDYSSGGKSTTEYFDATLSVRQTTMLSNNSIVSQGQSFFNGRGQTILSQSLAGNQWNAAQVKYDIMGRQLQSSLPYVSTASPTQWTSYQYDDLSRVTQVTAPDGSTSKTFYNETSRPSSASAAPGQTVRSQDAWGRERWARTDDFGRLVEVVEPAPNGNGSVFEAGNMVTSYMYSPKDELIQVNQGNQVRAFRYDSLGRLTRQKLAEQTGTINDAGQFAGTGLWSDAFVYDNRSNLVQRTDARGVKTNFNYQLGAGPDPLNRLQSISYDKSGAANPLTIADAAPVSVTYMTGGDRTRVQSVTTAGISTETNAYDIEGRVSQYTMTLNARPGNPLVMNYVYDSVNRLTEVFYPEQYGVPGSTRKRIEPQYDNASRLTQMKVAEQVHLSNIQYNPMSQVTELITGAYTGNADVEQYTYDAQTGLLTNQIVKKQNTNQPLLNLSYNYNRGNSKGSLNGKTGQLTNIVNNIDRNKDRVYEFDTLGRLTTAKGGIAAGGTGTANWTQNYTFDRFGNRTNVTATGVTANSQPVPLDGLGAMSYQEVSNRITNADYEFDAAGNQTRGKSPTGVTQRFDYDSAGRLVAVRDDNGNLIESYVYGASRQRLITINASLTTYYSWGGSSVLAEYTESTGNGATFKIAKSYFYAGSRLLSTQTWNGSTETTEFHHPDRLGTKLVTNNAANTSYEQSTLPFGTALTAESSGFSNQVFTSYDRSAGTGLDYAVNRNYSSGQGRFTTVDPIGMSATSLGIPQSLNLFAYVENNPIDFVDPSGLNLQAPSYFVCYDVTQKGHPAGTTPNDDNYAHTRTTTVCHFFGGGGGTGGNPNTDLDNASGGGGVDYGSKDCLDKTMTFLRNYAASELGTLGENAEFLVSKMLNFFQKTGDTAIITAAFSLANAYHETQLFRGFVESEASARIYGYDPVYRGRGYIHLTLKDNYKYSSEWLKKYYGTEVDLVANPDLAADPDIALQIMVAYFFERKTFRALSNGDIDGARRTINSNLNQESGSILRNGKKHPQTSGNRIREITNGLMDVLGGC